MKPDANMRGDRTVSLSTAGKEWKTSAWALLIVLIVFPLAYLCLSITPWSRELFAMHNDSFFFHFWGTVIVMHWLTLYVVHIILRREKLTFKDIGYELNRKRTVLLISILALVALLVFTCTELGLKMLPVNQEKLEAMGNFFPKTTAQRILFIFVAVTAGFCEEIIYRGFAITKLAEAGLNRWLSIIPAGITFVFIHGINGYFQFWLYFGAAVMFGLLFVSAKRLWPGIVIHALFDLMAIMAVFQAVDC